MNLYEARITRPGVSATTLSGKRARFQTIET
jgi:hypothetical protein